ncbi:alpha/beta hydrolase-fold protein [Winogradskyella sp. 3972H.M.0a.05]|uniref:alpha/beta hydrolase n=1 Tax=Winogradskyella sp. 3972H.M.0a.05 TaxID=2950277 RepID=UPI0033975C68
MRNLITLLLVCVMTQTLSAQAIYKEIDSDKLGEKRKIKIQLPRNYDAKDAYGYPLVVILDGDYLFDPVAGNIDYQAYWEDVPDCILVGIKQSDTREDDFVYDDLNLLPTETGDQFYQFVEKELLAFIEKNYNTSGFRIIIGHEQGANFVNYFLFKPSPVFSAYIALSPEIIPELADKLQEKLTNVTKDTFYYLATADEDIAMLRNDIEACNLKLSTVENEKFHYKYDKFTDANHYSLVGRGIPKALNSIFYLYKPITRKEYTEKVLTFEGSPYEYLMKKYQDVENIYGFKKLVSENDLRAIASASKKKDDIESLKNLSALAGKSFPESMIRPFYSAMYYEMNGELQRALKTYQSGLMLKPSQYIDKEMMLEKIYGLKEELKN